jgi:peptide/nickel transport system permease protein
MMGDEKKKRMSEQDYMSVVLRQLRKSKMGMVGLFFIFFLAVIAIFAPFLAEDIPLRISHSNETDEVCEVCVLLKESWDVLKLKDGAVLEGTFIREIPVVVFKEENKVVFEEEPKVVFEPDKGETKRIPKSRVAAIDRESTPQTLRVKEEDGKETTYKGKFLEEEPGETWSVPKSQVDRLDTESSPHTLIVEKDGKKTTYEGKFLKEEPGETIRFPKDEVDVVDTESSPNILRLLKGRKKFTGTFRGEEPGVIEFIVDEEKKIIPTGDKVSLEKLPRRHETRSIWPLLRGLNATDLFLLLGLGIFVFGFGIFLPLRRKGIPRGKAFNLMAMILALPVILIVVWIVLRDGERQLYKTVPFAKLEADRESSPAAATVRMTWPLLSRFGPESKDEKRVIPNQPPLWISQKEKYQKTEVKLAEEAVGENWREYASEHYLGTDTSKRDVMAMMIHGTRISLAVGVVSVSIYVTIGIIIGAIAGFFGGWIDDIICRIIEVVICFPTFFLIITIIAIMPPSIFWVMGAIAIVGWTTVARLVRAEFLKLRRNDFVTSAKALGASRTRIIFRHILPNSLAPVLVTATFGVAGAILTESGLSFLGLGVPPQIATWGSVLRLGQQGLPTTWWLALIPGLAIFMTVTSYNLFGEALRDAIDPRLKGTQ